MKARILYAGSWEAGEPREALSASEERHYAADPRHSDYASGQARARWRGHHPSDWMGALLEEGRIVAESVEEARALGDRLYDTVEVVILPLSTTREGVRRLRDRLRQRHQGGQAWLSDDRAAVLALLDVLAGGAK